MAALLAGTACGDSEGGSTAGGDSFSEPGSEVHVTRAEAELGLLAEQVDTVAALDEAGLAARYPVELRAIDYDPTQAAGYEQLQASNLGLLPEEEAVLRENGFVILDRHTFPSFFYGYLTVYGEDLPVFVSTDSILDALHRSYDDLLAGLERSVMIPRLQSLLSGMRARLASTGALDPQAAADAEFFLAVAHGLLSDAVPSPLAAGVESGAVQTALDKAREASGIEGYELFGVKRRVDFSQFEPRGHYEGDLELEPYFRAMMWLGRIDFRFLETQDDGSQVLRRRQVEAALALRELMGEAETGAWDELDAIVSTFVGEHDYMTVPQLAALLADLGVADLAGLATVDDQMIAQAIVDGGYGVQRIASHAMVNAGNVKTLPLSSSFAFFGQRYTVDSHVFSNLVHDRVGGRWLPKPLDAAFAALGNNQALSLLSDELGHQEYRAALGSMRVLIDAHPDEYWDGSLYTDWLNALRALSPATTLEQAAGMPAVATSEAWGRRILNTQLGSWSQLRHDTLLYVKQSYTVGTVCEFPDAYVDPYPEVFARIAHFAARGEGLAAELSLSPAASDYLASAIPRYFSTLGQVAGTLREMAELQRTGMPHSPEHMAFINEVVQVRGGGSGPPSVEGWYARLFFDSQRALEHDPIIADVHTDVGGEERPPRVLHVATADPRLMVMTADTCVGPRIYVGPVFSYHELAPEGIDRIKDSEWKAQLEAGAPDDVTWMRSLIAR